MFGSVFDYGTDGEATTVVTDLTCPADQFYEFNLLNCNLTDANSNNGCLSYEPQPVITCYNGKLRSFMHVSQGVFHLLSHFYYKPKFVAIL